MKHVIGNEGCNRDHQRFPYKKTSKTSAVKTGLRSSITCKYWINGNCMYGDQCRNLHSWSVSEGTSIDVKVYNLHCYYEVSFNSFKLLTYINMWKNLIGGQYNTFKINLVDTTF